VENGSFFRPNARCPRIVEGFNYSYGMIGVCAVCPDEENLALVFTSRMGRIAARFGWSERGLTCVNDTPATAVVELEPDRHEIGAGHEVVQVFRIRPCEVVDRL